MSDNLLHGTNRLFQYIACLFTTMLCHGIAPTGFLLSKLVPTPKNKRGKKCESNNYRQIAISSLLCKVFDIIILDIQSKSLSTDVLQFRFKKSSSTVICTSLMLETIDYYVENNTDCYLLLLDASKAFDRVEYVKLFTILRDRKLCPIVLRLLMNMYINQPIQVRWNNTLSNLCGISNGVKQGCCLSPSLFRLYINNLVNISRQIIVVVGMVHIIEMLKTCETFAKRHDSLFNASKSQLLWFGKSKKPENISLKMENGQVLVFKHLIMVF